MSLEVEFTIEPFVAGEPGPYGTTVAGDDEAVLTAVDRLLRAATAAGATRVSLQVVRQS